MSKPDSVAPSSNSADTDGGASSILGEAAILAVLTGVAYAAAFAYEAGYAGYFGYPGWMIEVRLSTVLAALGALLVFGSLVSVSAFVLLSAGLVIPYRGVWIVLRTFRRTIGALVFAGYFLWHLYSRHQPFTAWDITIGIMISLGALILLYIDATIIFPLTKELHRDYGLLDIWDAIATHRAEAEKKHFDQLAERSISTKLLDSRWFAAPLGFLLVISIPTMFLVGGVSLLGEFSAGRQVHFLVSVEEPHIVALRRYGDRLVTASFDEPSSTLKRTYQFLPAEDTALHWRDIYVDPLHVEEPCHDPACRWGM